MCKEFMRLSQRYGEKGTEDYVEGTDTVLSVNLDKMKTIPKNYQVVTYVRINCGELPTTEKGPNLRENNCGEKPNQVPF